MLPTIEHAVTRQQIWGLSASLSVGEQLSTHQHASNLGGARTDFIEFGVPEQPARRVIIDISVAAQQLNGIER